MFGTPDVQAIGNNSVPPDIIIESKPLRAALDDAVAQLRRYAWASPRMQRGRSVLTSGNQWWIYDLALPGSFTSRLVGQVDILEDDPPAAAPDIGPLAETYSVWMTFVLGSDHRESTWG